jgi:hypothetical protein
MTGGPPTVLSSPKASPEVDGADGEVDGVDAGARSNSEGSKHTSTAKEKYFIVKSLTLQDLESSVRNGIWATQSHNEDALNKAYEVRRGQSASSATQVTDVYRLRKMSI